MPGRCGILAPSNTSFVRICLSSTMNLESRNICESQDSSVQGENKALWSTLSTFPEKSTSHLSFRWLEAMDKAAHPVHQGLDAVPLGGLYLQGYRVNEQTLSVNQSVIELKPPSEEFKTFYFCAENKTENQRWITALKMSIKKWLPLHQAIQDFMNRPLEETRM
uniref:PH domain-containing protein n=1 Tax=Bos mutus grunniens TaxID=30521 RepID=A0A8B9Y9B6_BOSMU